MYTYYTKALTKLAREGKRQDGFGLLCCQHQNEQIYSPDAQIYVSDGHWVFRLNAGEYDQFIRPAAKCDPGTWAFINGDRIQSAESRIDPKALFYPDKTYYQIDLVGLASLAGNRVLQCGYSREGDFTVMYNIAYLSAISLDAGMFLFAADGKKPLLISITNRPEDWFGAILPITMSPKMNATIRAYVGA